MALEVKWRSSTALFGKKAALNRAVELKHHILALEITIEDCQLGIYKNPMTDLLDDLKKEHALMLFAAKPVIAKSDALLLTALSKGMSQNEIAEVVGSTRQEVSRRLLRCCRVLSEYSQALDRPIGMQHFVEDIRPLAKRYLEIFAELDAPDTVIDNSKVSAKRAQKS